MRIKSIREYVRASDCVSACCDWLRRTYQARTINENTSEREILECV